MILYFYKKIKKIIFLIIFFNNICYINKYFSAHENVIDNEKLLSFLSLSLENQDLSRLNEICQFFIINNYGYYLFHIMGYINYFSPNMGNSILSFAMGNELNWNNLYYLYVFVGFHYYDITKDFISKINMIFYKDNEIIKKINSYKNNNDNNEFSFFYYFDKLFHKYIKRGIFCINIINIFFHGCMLLLEGAFGQSIKNRNVFDYCEYDEEKIFHLFFRNYISINEETFKNQLTKIYQTNNRLLLYYIKENNSTLSIPALIITIMNVFFDLNKKYETKFQIENFLYPEQLFFKIFTYGINQNKQNILKKNLPYISYYKHLRSNWMFFFILTFFIGQQNNLNTAIKKLFEETNEALKKINIVFKKQNFVNFSIRNFYLTSKNKKNIFNILKKISKKIKNNKFNFNKFPPVFIYIIGDMGYGKTQILNFFENYLRKVFDEHKIKYNKAVFLGNVPMLQNVVKDYELQKIIPESLPKALGLENGFIIIEDVNQLLPNRAHSINIKKYMNINSFLTALNIGDKNAEPTLFSGVILATAQKGNMLDIAVCRRGIGVNINIPQHKKNNLKKFLLIKNFLNHYQNKKFRKFIEKYKIINFLKNFLENMGYHAHYQINFLLENLIIYMKFFSENIDIIVQQYKNKRKKILIKIYKKLKTHKDITLEKKELNKLDKDELYNYCLHSTILNYKLINEFVKFF